jgi:hypothetical protein
VILTAPPASEPRKREPPSAADGDGLPAVEPVEH